MRNRRDFLKLTALAGSSFLSTPFLSSKKTGTKNKPIVISTWNHGMVSNEISWDILSKKGSALDAVEKGVRVVESDPTGRSGGCGWKSRPRWFRDSGRLYHESQQSVWSGGFSSGYRAPYFCCAQSDGRNPSRDAGR